MSESAFDFGHGLHHMHETGLNPFTGDYIASISDARIREIVLAYSSNLGRMVIFATAPMAMVAAGDALRFAGDKARLSIWGNLDRRGPEDPKDSRWTEAFGIAWEEWLRAVSDDPAYYANATLEAAYILDLLCQEKTHNHPLDFLQYAITVEAIWHGVVTSAWTAFEVLAGDLWEAASTFIPRNLLNWPVSGRSRCPNRRSPLSDSSNRMTIRSRGIEWSGWNTSKNTTTICPRSWGHSIARTGGTTSKS